MAAGKCLLAAAVLLGVLWCVLAYNNRPPDIVIPTPKLPNPNGYDALVKASKLFPNLPGNIGPLSDIKPREWWTRQRYEDFMRQNGAGLAAVHEALKLPYRHPARTSYDDTSCFGGFSRMREAARRFAGEAMYYETINQPAEAADAGLDALQMGVQFGQGGDLLPMLVGSAVEGIALVSFVYLVPRLSPDELAITAARLERIESLRPPYSEIIREEGLTIVRCLMPLTIAPPVLELGKVFARGLSLRERWQHLRWGLASKKRLLRDTFGYYEDVARRVSGPYQPSLKAPPPANPLFEGNDGALPAKCWQSYTRRQTERALLRTEVAVRRYRAEHGRFPDTLQDVVPKYLGKVPEDPFGGGGKPLIYRPTGNGKSFLLYSRGFDMKDDGGKESAKPRDPELKGDMFLMGIVGTPWGDSPRERIR